MDQPLFGEQKQGTAAFQVIIGVVVVGFTIVTLIAGSIKGIHDAKLFTLVAAVLILFINLALLTKWYRDKEDRLHPKFKYLMVTLILAMLLVCAASQFFIWYKPPVPPAVTLCPGGFLTQTPNPVNPKKFDYQCYSFATGSLEQCTTPGFCITISGSSLYCNNCTAPSIAESRIC